MLPSLFLSLLPKKAKSVGMRLPEYEDTRRMFGRVLERALERAHIPKKEAAALLGYADQSSLGDWVAGVETPQLLRLFACLGDDFKVAFALELAREQGIRVTYALATQQRVSA